MKGIDLAGNTCEKPDGAYSFAKRVQWFLQNKENI